MDSFGKYITERFNIPKMEYESATTIDASCIDKLKILEGAAVLKEKYGVGDYLNMTMIVKQYGIEKIDQMLGQARKKGTDLGKLVTVLASLPEERSQNLE